MFTATDFLNLMKYLQGETVTPKLDKNLETLAFAEQAKVKQFFEATLDQNSFNTDDYKRLKNFLVDWYASHRTIVTTQRNALDPHALPEDHLNELIRNFGFDVPSSFKVLPYSNKPSFFLDLVNLYKIKGTPQAIIKLLGYFGISNINLLEYWLRKNSDGVLKFRGEELISADSKNINLQPQDLDFDSLTLEDPHWLLTEAQIEQMFLNNKIRLPSKTPYFGMRPTLHLNEIESLISIVTNQCQSEYNTWVSLGTLNQNIKLTSLNLTVSLLELYVACVYTFDRTYSRNGQSGSNIICYDGTSIITNDIMEEYKYLIGSKRLLPTEYNTARVKGRLNRQNQLNDYYNQFTRSASQYFLSDATSNVLLYLLNPDLKDAIDSYFVAGNEDEVLGNLIKDLGSWIGSNIGLDYTNISNFILGLQNLEFLIEIINFFKPYRSRLILVENIYLIDNPLADSQIVEDALRGVDELNSFVDFDTADSEPGYATSWLPTGEYVTSTPLIGDYRRVGNMYVDSTGEVKIDYDDFDSTSTIQTLIYSNPQVDQYRVTNIYLDIHPTNFTRKLVVDYNSDPETVGGVSTYITSLPVATNPAQTYIINDIYLDVPTPDRILKIVYDGDVFQWPVDSDARVYYSRNTFDNGSYFDIGASSDNPPNEPDVTIITDGDDFIEKYNYHSTIVDDDDDIKEHIYHWDSTGFIITDSTSGDDIYHDSTAQIIISTDLTRNSGSNYVLDDSGILTPEHMQSCYQYGGFTNFDEGGVLDAPFASEICQITVVNAP